MVNEKEIKSIIASVLQNMDFSSDDAHNDGMLDDITEVDIRQQFLVPEPIDEAGYLRMKEKTPARLGLWRAGPRYKTEPMLRFRADHAAAQDAVFSYVCEDLIKEMNFICVQTKCRDKDEYITRPDLGRQFDEENANIIADRLSSNPQVQIIVGDGLSSAAIEANIKDVLPSIGQGLQMFGLEYKENEVLFIKHARVPAMDQIGDITGADVICYLIGERPGLVSAESMSAYIAYKPTVGMPEARRTVVSNIHKGGTPAVEAGAYISELIKKMIDHKKSGIELREV